MLERKYPVSEGGVGEGGKAAAFARFQAAQVALALLAILATALSQTNYVFSAQATDYRCAVPECELADASAAPPSWWPGWVTDRRCSRPLPLPASGSFSGTDNGSATGNCTAEQFSNATAPCDKWIYADHNSIFSEFELACQEWKRTMVGTVHNVGVLFSMPIMGYISDRWGRRRALIISSVGLVTGALKTLATSYTVYLAIELLEGTIASGTYTTAFVIMLELIGNDKRIFSSTALGIAIACGDLTLALIVWLVPYWRHFQLLIYLPPLLFLSYILVLEESLRWLLTNGETKRAKALMKKIAWWNGVNVSEKELEMVQDANKENDIPVEKFAFKLIFSSKILLKRLVVCSWWWFSTALVYYGLVIGSAALPGTPVLNFALSALATVPGELMAFFSIARFGRRWPLFAGFFFCGVSCLVNGFVPQDQKVVQIAIYLLGKAAISLCFNVVYIYTSELMPTSARGSMVGACSTMARVGSILAPLTPLLSSVWASFPTMLFGCVALGAAAATLTTPETLGRDLPDTIAQAEAMTKSPSGCMKSQPKPPRNVVNPDSSTHI